MAGYIERPVGGALAGRVVCTWVGHPCGPRQPVLPDACIDIVWDGASLRVAGPDTGPVPVTSLATFVGIRFRPGRAPGCLGVPAGALRDQSVPLRELWGAPADELAERLAERPHRAPELLERALLERRAPDAMVDPLAVRLLDELRHPRTGHAPVESLARRLEVSERTLRRRSIAAFGYGPKTLERILRFRHALRLLRVRVPLVRAAQAAGYADQAHLSAEFRRLAGRPPGRVALGAGLVLSANGYDDDDGGDLDAGAATAGPPDDAAGQQEAELQLNAALETRLEGGKPDSVSGDHLSAARW
jgi:AraC-like DNA-binding protein